MTSPDWLIQKLVTWQKATSSLTWALNELSTCFHQKEMMSHELSRYWIEIPSKPRRSLNNESSSSESACTCTHRIWKCGTYSWNCVKLCETHSNPRDLCSVSQVYIYNVNSICFHFFLSCNYTNQSGWRIHSPISENIFLRSCITLSRYSSPVPRTMCSPDSSTCN